MLKFSNFSSSPQSTSETPSWSHDAGLDLGAADARASMTSQSSLGADTSSPEGRAKKYLELKLDTHFNISTPQYPFFMLIYAPEEITTTVFC